MQGAPYNEAMRFVGGIWKRARPREPREAGLAELERALGVRFKDRAFLRQALIHRSYLNEANADTLASYDRLEFLGDAFLGWVVADELYARCPGYDEGDMTRARALHVKGATLAEVARSIRLGDYLQLGQGEADHGGRTRPRTLAAALEAVIAAVLLDRGQPSARKLVLRLLGTRLDGFHSGVAPRDSKSMLQEVAQRDYMELPRYEVVPRKPPADRHGFTATVRLGNRTLGEGTGRRKADAEQAAAAEALRNLRVSEPATAEE